MSIRSHHMLCIIVSIQRLLRCPFFDKDKFIFVIGVGKQLIPQTSRLCLDQRFERLLSLNLLIALARHDFDEH